MSRTVADRPGRTLSHENVPVARCLVFAALAAVAAGCSIKSPRSHWEQLAAQPHSRVVTPTLAIATLPATEVRVPDRIVLRIDNQDPLVALDGHVSYGKLLRFAAEASRTYDVTVEAWCDPCPPTAILWGETELPVFVPRVTLLNQRGEQMTTIDGRARSQERLSRNMPLKGTWHLQVSATGPHYLLITSDVDGPRAVAPAGNIADFVASPVGKIRVAINQRERRRHDSELSPVVTS